MCIYLFSIYLSLICFSFLINGCHCIKFVLLSIFMEFYVLHTLKTPRFSFLLLLIKLTFFDSFILKTFLFHP